MGSKLNIEILIAGKDQGAGKVVEGIGKSLGNIGTIAGGILSARIIETIAGKLVDLGRAAIGGIKDTIGAASDLNEALNASSVVFGDAAGVVQDFGRIASETAGLSATTFNQMAAETGAMLKNFGISAEEAAGNTVDLAQRAADMASIFNTDVADAMSAIQSGLQGQSMPLRRFGVDMSDAAVKAKALEMGLGDITRQTDATAYAQAAMALLFEQTNDIAGDFVNTSDQLANATRVQQARWENFQSTIGQKLLPVTLTFKRLFMDIAERVFPIALQMMDKLAPILDGISEGISYLADVVLGGKLQNALQEFGPLEFLVQAFGEMLPESIYKAAVGIDEFIAKAWEMIQPIVDAITQFVSWQDILIGLGAIIGVIIGGAIMPLISSVLAASAVIAGVIGVVSLVRNAWEKDWGGIRTALTGWWTGTGQPIFTMLREWLQVNIPKALEMLKQFWLTVLLPAIQAVWAWISGTLIPFFQNTVVPWLQEYIPKALETLRSFWQNVLLPGIQAVWGWISGTLIPFFQNTVVPWLQEKIPAAIETLRGFWENVLLPAIQAVWGFIEDTLMPLLKALVDFFDTAFSLALTALAGLWENVLQPAFQTVGDYVRDHLQPVIENLSDFWKNTLGPALTTVKESVLDKLAGVFGGIRDAIQWVIDKITIFTDKLKNVKLPWWLTPGSPTPFELGLSGISDALGEINNLRLPAFSTGLSMAGAAAGVVSRTTNINLTAQYGYQSPADLASDVRLLEAMYG